MGAITIGVDIDPKYDLTAIAVVEKVTREGADGKSETDYQVRYLEQLPNGPDYVRRGEGLAQTIEGMPPPS